MTSPNNYIKTPVIHPSDIDYESLSILAKSNLAVWCKHTGVKVDGNPIDFENHRYLLPIYADNSDYMVWLKAAQTGSTAWQLCRILWWLESHPGRKAGIYFPTRDAADNMSQDRLEPVIRSCPSINKIYDADSKMSLRKIGESSLYVFHLGGTASKDSVPLDYINFDEVRLMSLKDVDQAMERISHSPYKMTVMGSTCGMPNDTIHKMFLQGNQLTWHVTCNCPDGCDLARQWPDCVVDDITRKELYLRCTKCRARIMDTQNGRYVAHNPSGDFNSYHNCQLHSKYIDLRRIWRAYKTTSNMSEFMNAKLGLPYIDEDNRGTTREVLETLKYPDTRWWKDDPKRGKTRTAMGVDVGAGYLYVTVLALDKDGKKCLRHVEVIERHNKDYFSLEGKQVSPFIRLKQMMNEFNVGICVVDQMPNADEVIDMTREFPGRVFAANYTTGKDAVVWSDRATTPEGVRKAGKWRTKYYVNVHRYIGMQSLFSEFNTGMWRFPNYPLIQKCRDESSGALEPIDLLDRWMDQATRLVKEFVVHDEKDNTGTWKWIYTGFEPHSTHSLVYANTALERLRKQVIWAFA